jgi:hypothetical protein
MLFDRLKRREFVGCLRLRLPRYHLLGEHSRGAR